jgi:hypothetical protein
MQGLVHIGQVRTKVTSTRVPPWRKWVKGRERVPEIAFNKTLEVTDYINSFHRLSSRVPTALLPGVGTSLVSLTGSDSLDAVSMQPVVIETLTASVPSLRKFLVPSSPLRKRAKAELDAICGSLSGQLTTMTSPEKVRALCAFGQLVDYTVSNRVADRYNSKLVLYDNTDFYSKLIGSIDWSEMTDSLGNSPSTSLMHIVRSLSRLRGSVSPSVLNPALSELLSTPSSPAHLVELLMISARHKLSVPELTSKVLTELDSNFSTFKEDYIGDIARSLTSLGEYSPDFHRILLRELPVRTHELLWWNVIDIADYFATVPPPTSSAASRDFITRIGNEIWKWIPEMRSGYVAKALRVVSALDTSDERTRRALVRSVPKSLGKLHPHVVAESIVAATKVGYLPKKRYGKKYGSLFYRRMMLKLNHADEPLVRVGAGLVVEVLESIHRIGRPNFEFFDTVLDDIERSSAKYSPDQLVRVKRVMDASGRVRAVQRIDRVLADHTKSASLSLSNLAYLSAHDEGRRLELLAKPESELAAISVADMVTLIRSRDSDMSSIGLGSWLDQNLNSMTDREFTEFTSVLVGGGQIDSTVVALLGMRLNALDRSLVSTESLVKTISAMLAISEFNFALIDPDLFSSITGKPVMDLKTLELCQLISAHARVADSITVHDQLFKFLNWIESHLVSRIPSSPADAPPGTIPDLWVWPVRIPLAVPGASIDLRALHECRTATEIRRILKGKDCGLAVMGEPSCPVLYSLRSAYLRKLGWTVVPSLVEGMGGTR